MGEESMDPRAENCKAFHETDGLVDGVELVYKENPTAKYQLLAVAMIDEAQNGVGGPTVATIRVLNKDGIETPERVYMCYPWFNYSTYMLPGNPNQEHVVSNKFYPPDLGPLAIFVGLADHTVISDEIAGFGLPTGHHISFALTFKERSAAPPTEPPTEPPIEPPVSKTVLALLRCARAEIDAALRLLGAV